jgi:ParB family transcriptional regulator, chromosome partitioning protein
MSKADHLGTSSSFAAAAAPRRSTRGTLIAAATGEDPTPAEARTARLADLAHNPFNPRHELGDLQETADSLLERGQIQPVTVVTRQAFLTAHPGQDDHLGTARYVVIDGNRRLGAARLAGLDDLRIDVNDALAASAADILESALVANLHRENLTPLEEAEALATLMKVYGSQRQVARRVGKTNMWVSQRLALLNLTPELQDALRDGSITVEDARQVARLPQDQQADDAAVRKERRENPPAKDTPAPPTAPQPAGSGNAANTSPGTAGSAADSTSVSRDPVPPRPQAASREASQGVNAVSTLSPERPSADSVGTPSAPPPAQARPTAPGGSGNGVYTKPADTRPDHTFTINWDDLAGLAGLLRENLDAGQRQALADLITADR